MHLGMDASALTRRGQFVRLAPNGMSDEAANQPSRGAIWVARVRWLPIVYLVVVIGLGLVAARPRYVVADSWPQQSSDSKARDLADLVAGARVSVSSYDAAHGRHPLFAIDGEFAA